MAGTALDLIALLKQGHLLISSSLVPRRDEFLDQDCQGFRFPGLVGTSQGDDETYSNNAKEANSDTIEDPTRHSTIDINLLLMYLGTHVLPSPRFTLKLIAPIVTHFYLWNI